MKMLTDIKSFSEIIALIYAAALEPAQWQLLLDRLGIEMPGSAFHLFGYDFETGVDLGMMTTGYDTAYLPSYAEYYCHKNVWAEGWMKLDSSQPTYSQQMCSQEELLKSEFYNDWIKPQEDIRAGGGIMLNKTHQRMFVIGGNIRKRDEDACEGDWIRALGLLKPHLENAFQINRRLMGRSLFDSLALPALNPLGTMTLVINDRGHLLYACEAATNLVIDGELLRSDAANRVIFDDVDADLTLQRVLHSLQQSNVLPGIVCVSGKAGAPLRRKYEFIAFRGAHTQAALGFISGLKEKCVLVTVTQEAEKMSPRLELSHIYRLTAAETDVAMMLVDGLSASEIAHLRETSVVTVRNQIKSAMSKCGVRRQLDLMRMLERRDAR